MTREDRLTLRESPSPEDALEAYREHFPRLEASTDIIERRPPLWRAQGLAARLPSSGVFRPVGYVRPCADLRPKMDEATDRAPIRRGDRFDF